METDHSMQSLGGAVVFAFALMVTGAMAEDAGGAGEGAAAPAMPAAAVCGERPITIARMIWPSAEIMAAIHARILSDQFGCKVAVQTGDMAATVSGMATTGEPAVAPEIWVGRIADIWNQAVKSQKVRPAGPSYETASFEGWYVPDYLAEAHPELGEIAGIKAHPEWFASPDGSPPTFLSCPADWACSIINRNLMRAEGLDGAFTVVTPKNRFELDNRIAEAVGRRQPILFYYWQPNAVLSQFAFRKVALGPYDKDSFACLGRRDCADPKPSGFPPEPVLSVLADWVYTDAPEIAAYFQRAVMPIEVMNGLLEKLNAPGATADTVAAGFMAEDTDLWRRWVGTLVSAGAD